MPRPEPTPAMIANLEPPSHAGSARVARRAPPPRVVQPAPPVQIIGRIPAPAGDVPVLYDPGPGGPYNPGPIIYRHRPYGPPIVLNPALAHQRALAERYLADRRTRRPIIVWRP
jgi:hypothetical protein